MDPPSWPEFSRELKRGRNYSDLESGELNTSLVRFNNEEVPADEEDLLKNLTLASESVWLQLFVIIIVAVTCIFVIINVIGCAGTCLMSYSLLSGFTIFMMLASILAVTMACSLLLPLHSSTMDSPLAPLVSRNNKLLCQSMWHDFRRKI